MQSSLDTPPSTEPEGLGLSPAGRRGRLGAVVVILALLLAGTVWGDDDAFPFGPFRMYSTRNDPNTPVISTRAVGLTAAGEEVRLSGGQVGLRRAEFEGQINRLREHPELLGLIADAYAESNPAAPELVTVQMVHRKFELADGKPTGDYTDTVVVEFDLEDGTSEDGAS
ncbi:hypothetical protein DQ239_10960 [Blastococcus sp. TF02-09]|uniref:hypothetical protein n=1 Tax=Blastococcus sp. TF02-09 TaxID=2250576 RepID=UPI000DEAD370|nr:hypothetical protein [Blastococcus sp. TF02-9]RBY77400.1 hypothetical protein DQ239_10960 [Blastococcus sp. TF02-9]